MKMKKRHIKELASNKSFMTALNEVSALQQKLKDDDDTGEVGAALVKQSIDDWAKKAKNAIE